ncbi:MAG: RNA polymerase sigma-70 factor [Bacteroidota bacterium]
MHETLPFAAWCRRIQASDRAAFTELYQALQADLIRYALRVTHDERAAQDVVQETFVKVWQKRETLDPNRSLRALLYTTTRNLSINVVQSYRNRYGEADAEGLDRLGEASGVEARIDADRLSRRMQAWIEELPERRREAFRLSRDSGLSHDEIAEVMQVSPRTVNTHIVLALRFLRERLHAFEGA